MAQDNKNDSGGKSISRIIVVYFEAGTASQRLRFVENAGKRRVKRLTILPVRKTQMLRF